jgi:hypothetical protein
LTVGQQNYFVTDLGFRKKGKGERIFEEGKRLKGKGKREEAILNKYS